MARNPVAAPRSGHLLHSAPVLADSAQPASHRRLEGGDAAASCFLSFDFIPPLQFLLTAMEGYRSASERPRAFETQPCLNFTHSGCSAVNVLHSTFTIYRKAICARSSLCIKEQTQLLDSASHCLYPPRPFPMGLHLHCRREMTGPPNPA